MSWCHQNSNQCHRSIGVARCTEGSTACWSPCRHDFDGHPLIWLQNCCIWLETFSSDVFLLLTLHDVRLDSKFTHKTTKKTNRQENENIWVFWQQRSRGGGGSLKNKIMPTGANVSFGWFSIECLKKPTEWYLHRHFKISGQRWNLCLFKACPDGTKRLIDSNLLTKTTQDTEYLVYGACQLNAMSIWRISNGRCLMDLHSS